MLAQFLISLVAAGLAVALALAAGWLRRNAPRPPLEREIEPIVFLFRDRVLLDATRPAQSLIAALPGQGDWQRLTGWLATCLPDGAEALAALDEARRLELTGDCGLRILTEHLDDRHLRVTLQDRKAENAGIVVDSLTLGVMEREIDLLRNAMDASPMLAWRQDGQGNVTWSNAAYLQLAEESIEDNTIWPLPRLLDLPDATTPPGPLGNSRRVQMPGDRLNRWFDCYAHAHGDESIAIALPADAAVRAERSLREFVQTLTKTFADLPIGLAIFDRDRNLQLFNPALIDLTGLSTGFLIARPTLYAFLDRLREARMVPEPRDYRSWRQQISSLEAAAASGRHVEVWSLPGGQTYRVTGRPHPDGAVAFLFEDITSEISLTRKFRAELSLGAEVLNALDDAVAVFAPTGEALTSNRRYAALWGDPAANIDGHAARFREVCGDGPGLAALCQAMHEPRPAGELRGAVMGPEAGLLSWEIRILSGGRFMLCFQAPLAVSAPNSPSLRSAQIGPLDLQQDISA
ncbi:PAS-domain containing protein [Paracoccus ravus]|uniref:PAS-domain containing protein n=1 Tax=Paracoccus ravus TaxID=2447760 RepID=UPI00106E6406|nr:PAS-domain containing protein [Paracoccus ravus]